MPPPRPRGANYNAGVASVRPSPNTPMSERQQMALLIQMTAPSSSADIPKPHVKKGDQKKNEDIEEIDGTDKHNVDDLSKEKTITDDSNMDSKKDNINDSLELSSNIPKRSFSDIDEDDIEDPDEIKKKKRKDSDSGKNVPSLRLPSSRTDKNIKHTPLIKNSPTLAKNSSSDKETDGSKMNYTKSFENDAEEEDFKISDMYNGGLKVPPLKIVIPQQNCSIDTDGNISRTGKVNTSRNSALPYVVSSNNESNERDGTCCSPQEGSIKINTICAVIDEKSMKLLSEEKNLQRVLRSSHKSGITVNERSSNNSSPQLQSNSPSPASLNANEPIDAKGSFSNLTISPLQHNQTFEHDNIINLPSPSTSSTSSSKEIHSTADLHPRKRKIRSKNEDSHLRSNVVVEATSSISDNHPHDYPFTNCFQMFINIRRQIEKKWKNLYHIKPRPPQGYNEYLINKKTYLLYENKPRNNIDIPPTVHSKMESIFLFQQQERDTLMQRHIVEREKLCLNVEQEIIRVHTKAARHISCQPVPYSVCTLLKDEEVYNIITPEQEEKDRNARYRFNGRLLLSWLQDVDDKWEKIKESMVLRHHNEAESLHAIQLMDWEIALKNFNLFDYKSQLTSEKEHVPIVYVSDDFDLLPA